jgi:dolichol-phosphate mannosyltransferase
MATTDEAVVGVPVHRRVHRGLRKPANWLQLVRFGAVGGSGYVVNVGLYTLLVHAAGVDYRAAAVLGFVAALINNFFWNRHWTFDASDGHAGFQAARFLVVSLGAFAVQFALLQLLVESGGVEKVPAQALSILAAMPLNFLGNKLWSFGR